MIFLGWPLLLLLIDTLWGIAALVLGALARVLFRRPWILVAETEGDKRVWQVRTWRVIACAERNGDRVLTLDSDFSVVAREGTITVVPLG